MQATKSRCLFACLAWALVLAASRVASYKICLNLNQVSAELARHPDKWAKARQQVDCVFGMGAGHPTDPMSNEQRKRVIQLLSGREFVLLTNWQIWEGQQKPGIDKTNVVRINEDRYGMDVSHMFIFDQLQSKPRSTLRTWQLDKIRAFGTKQVLINCVTYGATPGEKAITQASMGHPHVRGVVTEGSPRGFVASSSSAQIVWDAYHKYGKEVYLLLPPCGHAFPNLDISYTTLVHQTLDNLRAVLGDDALKGQGVNDRVHLVMSAYTHFTGSCRMKMIPDELAGGRYADTFLGAIASVGEGSKSEFLSGNGIPACLKRHMAPHETGVMNYKGICAKQKPLPLS